jgi:hypothetical protein
MDLCGKGYTSVGSIPLSLLHGESLDTQGSSRNSGWTTLQSIAQPAFCGLVHERKTIEERDVVFREGVGVLWDQGGVDSSRCSLHRIESRGW